MSLRLRLIMAFLAIVSVMVGVSVVSLQISGRVQERVSDLTSASIAEFEKGKSLGKAFEVEGSWRTDQVFVADDIERLPGPRRPKLRGRVQAVDPVNRRITVYGVSIEIDDTTEFIGEGGVRNFESLSAGRRVEISCSIDDGGHWRARKLRSGDIKDSDKVKGTVTDVFADGVAPDSIGISGIMIEIGSHGVSRDLRREFRQISLATRMNQAAQECGLGAQHVLSGSDVTVSVRGGEVEDARTLMVESAEDFEYLLGLARAGAAAAATRKSGSDSRSLEVSLWLDPLAGKSLQLKEYVREFLELADSNAAEAEEYFFSRMEPFLHDELLPLIQTYQIDVEEKLAMEVERISEDAAATARVLMVTSVIALAVAMGLGFVVWRSISKPILKLKDAAENIGHGALDTRVTINSRDELGVLANTINRMAEELTTSMVSIANLDNIIDSMSGALIVLDSEKVIVSVNRAAQAMLGYEKDELTGRSFETVCDTGGSPDCMPDATRDLGAIEERTFRRKDGTTFPVSFSGAALRSGAGPLQGFVCVAQDLTERKNFEEKLRQSVGEKELLLREVHHRVKNNLQVVSSLLDLQSSHADNRNGDGSTDSQNRIRSMALIHEQLYRSTDLDKIDFKSYLTHLTDSLFYSHTGLGGPVSLSTRVDPIRLDIDQALACGLIINELVTNSLKHAFEDGENGTITIQFLRADEQTLELIVADDGRGIQTVNRADSEDSLGMSLVTALVEQLGGEMKISAGKGTEFWIRFKPTVPVGEVLGT